MNVYRIIVVGMLVIGALWEVAISAIQAETRAAMDHARAETRNLAAAFADEVLHVLRAVDDGMKIVEQHMSKQGSGPFNVHDWAADIPMLSWAAIQVAIVGPDGHLISTTLDPHPKPIDLNDREHIRAHLDHRVSGLFIGKPVRGRVSHQVTIQVTRRVDGADGRLLGIILFSLAPSDLTSLNKSIDLGPDGVIVLTRLDDTILARFTPDDPTGLAGIGKSIAGGTRPSSFPEGAEGTYIKNGAIDHIKRLLAYRKLPNYPLVVTVGFEFEHILAAPRAHGRVILLIAGAATALLLWLGIYLIREIVARAHHALELAAEKGKLAETNRLLEQDIKQREHAEGELREAKETLHDAVESISEAFVIYDRDDRFVMCNEAYRGLFSDALDLLVPGVAFDALIRRGVETGQSPTAIGREEEWIAERLEYHRHPSGAYELNLHDGRCLLATERRMRNGGTAGLRIDVTRLKSIEAQLRRTMERLDRVQRVAGIGSMEVALPGTHIEWSAGACAIFGVEPEAVEPTLDFVLSFVHPDDRARVAEGVAQSRLTEIAAPPIEYRIIRADGAERIVYRENALEYGPDGRAVRRIVTFKDITELKAAERRLREIKANLDRAQRLSHTGSDIRILGTDYAYWSDEMYRIFGVDPESFTPTTENFIQLVLPEDQRAIWAARAQITAGTNPGALEYRIRRPSGEIRYIRRLTELIHDNNGAVIGYAGCVHDVTELRAVEARQRELERQLFHSQKLEALGTLAGGVAHDLNNTLQPILMLGKLVLDDLPVDSPIRPEVAIILQAGERARDLVKQIVAFCRKQELQKTEVDIALVVTQALGMVGPTLPPDIAIIKKVGAVPLILADPGQLEQVIVNLVTNAAHSIGDGAGSITVEVSVAAGKSGSDFVQIRVADTGCGMEQEVLRRIFEPFFTTKGVGEGTGLGLAVVHGIVTGHGGTIDVNSEPGVGTVFTILLPISEPASHPAALSLEAAA